jgi:anaerobic selenocysteine-containing dehydrogenase
VAETQVTYCRLCQACCGLLVEIDDGRVVTARGDGQNPASRGFTCPKGRSIGEYHHHPDRLLSSRKRGPDGEWSTISSGLAIEEVGHQLQEIRTAHGPDAIATFWGTQAN